jgi:hypothetical protein
MTMNSWMSIGLSAWAHHRHGQRAGVHAADVAIERQAGVLGRRLGDRQARAQNRVGPQPALVDGAVELDHERVDVPLICRIEPPQDVADLAVDRGDRPAHALAAESRLVAVAQLDRLVGAGRGAGRHRRAAKRAGLELHVHLDGRVAARIQDLAPQNADYRGHHDPSPSLARR